MNEDDLITVYNYAHFEPGTDTPVLANYKASRDTVVTVFKQVLLEGTGERVPKSALDGEGRYRRVATGWGAVA